MNGDSGGDGAAIAVPGEPPVEAPKPIEGDKSNSQADLEAKIEEELGLPHTPPKTADEPDEPDEPPEPAEDEPDEPEPAADEPAGEENTPKPEPTAPAEPSNKEFFIEVEDAEGVTHKISSINDLPEDFQYKNNRQPLEIYRQLDTLEADKAAYDKEQAEAAAAEAETQAQNEQFAAWDKEIAELGKQKRLDVNDQTVIDKVFAFMTDLNDARTKAGNPNLITSFEDALDKYEAKQAKDAAADKTKQENDRAKAKSGFIGGGGASGANSPQPYRSGQYRSIDDIPVSV